MTAGISQAVSDVIAPRNIIIPTITNIGVTGAQQGFMFMSGGSLCWMSGTLIRVVNSRDL